MTEPGQELVSIVRHRDPMTQGGFTQIANLILLNPDLSVPARLCYAILKSYAWNDSQPFPGQDRLALVMNVSDRSIRTYLSELADAGLLTIERRGLGQSNIYWLEDSFRSDRKLVSGLDRIVASGLDRKPASDKEDEDLKKTKKEARAGSEDGSAGRKERSTGRSRPRDPYLDHPAVQAYRDRCKLTPNEEQLAAIAEAVTDLDQWRATLQAWMLRGYRPTNVEGLLDAYHRRGHGAASASPAMDSGDVIVEQPADEPSAFDQRMSAFWQSQYTDADKEWE